MFRRTVTFLVALFSGVGGHFLNRRWDRAVIFIGVLTLWAVSGYLLVFGVQFKILNSGDPSLDFTPAIYTATAYILVFALLWLASIVVTIRDSGATLARLDYHWTWGKTIGALVLSLIAVCALVFAGFSASTVITSKGKNDIVNVILAKQKSKQDSRFWKQLYYGRPATKRHLPPPPTGKGYLVGKISYRGKPVPGVQLDVVLNRRYRARGLVTNRRGGFILRLPPGEWYLTAIETFKWPRKPAGKSLTLIGGHEASLHNSTYRLYPYWKKQGLAITVSKRPPKKPVLITISPFVELIWPDPDLYKNQTIIKDGTIKWRAYPRAHDYVVTIRQITRQGEGQLSTYRIISRRVHKRTYLSLAGLAHIKETDAEAEYVVEVMAFDKGGRLLGRSERNLDRGTFVLIDNSVLIERKLAAKARSPQELRVLRRDKRLFQAAGLLIQERLLQPAEKTLLKISGIGKPGKKEALLGLVKAMQGLCVSAQRYYAIARAKGGVGVLPAKRQKYCRKKASRKTKPKKKSKRSR